MVVQLSISVAEHWLYKPGVLGFISRQLPAFSYFFASKHLHQYGEAGEGLVSFLT